MKKLLALLLAVAMVIGMVACGNVTEEVAEPEKPIESNAPEAAPEEPEVELEPVTIQWILSGDYGYGEKEGTQDVFEAFNKRLETLLPNTTVEFTIVTDYATNWPMLVAGEEKMDIAWASTMATDQLQDTLDGNVLCISDLVDQYAPNIKEEMEIWPSSYASVSLDGELYGIPCIQPSVAESQAFRYFEIIEPYINVDAIVAEFRNSTKLTAKTLDIIEEAIQAAIDDGAMKVGDVSWYINEDVCLGGMLGYVPISDNLYYDPEAANPVPLHMWEIPEFKMVVERMAQWADKGWITETQILGQLPDDSQMVVNFTDKWNVSWAGCDENGIKPAQSNQWTYYSVCTNTPEEGYIGPDTFGSARSYHVIPFTSDDPERAMMLLDLLHDEVGTPGNDLLNLLCYGFEKNSDEAAEYGWYNYEAIEEDGQMKADISVRGENPSKHEFMNWMIGNTFKAMHDGGSLTTRESREYAMNFSTEIYPKLNRTALAGIIFDTSMLSLEFEAMNAVFEEYNRQMKTGCGGAAEVDGMFDAALAKLENAGFGTVRAELQSQIDAYIAK